MIMSKSIFKDCKIYFHPGRLGKKRLDLLVKLVLENGGEVCHSRKEDSVTHIVVEESCDISGEQYEDWCQNANVVTTKWLSQSVKDKKCLDAEPFVISNNRHKRIATDESANPKKKFEIQGKSKVQPETQEETTKAEEDEVWFLFNTIMLFQTVSIYNISVQNYMCC